ncbi:hypothetical protein KDI_37500 [Dictyobacter arantiisoli]|uniref:Uncharacterized protein n=1 Tax=Dictyobacter arantiisoli TaxID=2014874 RepID=A0A5A5TGA5_9CHLR|nr:hypothetical protein KDI_37500 [Dictyobacter arantiisoli]
MLTLFEMPSLPVQEKQHAEKAVCVHADLAQSQLAQALYVLVRHARYQMNNYLTYVFLHRENYLNSSIGFYTFILCQSYARVQKHMRSIPQI